MKKKLALLAVLALALTGCGAVEGEEIDGESYPNTHYSFVQELEDGTSVLCIWAKSGYGGGLSCDWANRE